ncbi:12018_t:CDS:2 [Cetraspora pellucida]|uniref:12018_t:CDS:1 n=1 Tax=Cetraspora pellucida TaxID=1433469 RepID=A0ACA9K1R2_9GLOM|nr:12018_t:CDS:2 [Cetraspora pellucida]
MSIVSSNSRASSNYTQISETSSTSSHLDETSQQHEFNHLLLRLMVQNSLSFRFIESSTLHQFVNFFNPSVKIPNRQMISTKILVEYAEKLEKDKVFTLSKLQEPVTIMFDNWKNVRCQEILGTVILSATNQLYIWGAEDISDCSQKTPDVLNTIYNFFECAKNQNLNVVAMVTDSALAYTSASDERFENTIDTLLAENVAKNVAKNIIGLALLPYWEFAAIDQKEIKSSFEQKNKINNPIALDLSENMHILILDDSETPNKNDYNTNDYDSDDYSNDENEEITNDESIFRELVKDDNNENEDLEALTTTSYDTTNMQNCHPAKHKGSKIELQYLFTHTLSQPLFVRTLQQDVE